jgi:hypothetical protein
MSSPPSPPPPELSHGVEIEYKAFARSFFQNAPQAAVLCLVATCSYGSTGYTIFFERDSDKFKLMEQPPTGIIHFLQTFYAATWPTQGVSFESELPTHVTIVDAQGEHSVEVKPWQ